jgi:hypothetical protein
MYEHSKEMHACTKIEMVSFLFDHSYSKASRQERPLMGASIILPNYPLASINSVVHTHDKIIPKSPHGIINSLVHMHDNITQIYSKWSANHHLVTQTMIVDCNPSRLRANNMITKK